MIPESLLDQEIGHQGLTDLRVAGTMHERKTQMYELSDAFIRLARRLRYLRGAAGDANLVSSFGLQEKPCGLLSVAGFYGPLVSMFDYAVAEGFVRPRAPGFGTDGRRPA